MTSEEKALYAMGGECVTGDLLLNREVVGQYRHGQFVITAAGQAALTVESPAKAVKPAKGKGKDKDEPSLDDLDLGDLGAE